MNALFLLKPKDSVAYLREDFTLRQGLEKMRAHGYAAIPVIKNDGSYYGSISEGDFLWFLYERGGSVSEYADHPLKNLMRPDWNPPVRVDVDMSELLLRAANQNFVPVTDDRGLFIGIITRKDILCYFMQGAKSF